MAFHVRVDDTDPRLQYEGSWFVASNTLFDNGDFGAPYNHTLHGTNSDSSLNFSFSGTEISALGSSTSGGSTQPTFECLINGTRLYSLPPPVEPRNNWELCRSDTLPAGTHNFSLIATASQPGTFWFDQVQYAPVAGTLLADETVGIDNSHPTFSFGGDWQELRGEANFTQTSGSFVDFSFIGTSVTWYGFVLESFPPNVAEASYSIDDQPETAFLLQGHLTDDDDHFNQVFFRTPTLDYGNHSIRVTHKGNDTQTPLVLDYIVVEGSAPGSKTSLSPTAPGKTGHTHSTPATLAPTNGYKNVGGIIAAAMAGIFALISLACLMCYFAKKRRLRKPGPALLEDELPSLVDPAPPVYSFSERYHNGSDCNAAVVYMDVDVPTATPPQLLSVKSHATPRIPRTPTKTSDSTHRPQRPCPQTSFPHDSSLVGRHSRHKAESASELRPVNVDTLADQPLAVNDARVRRSAALPFTVRDRDGGLWALDEAQPGRTTPQLPPLYFPS